MYMYMPPKNKHFEIYNCPAHLPPEQRIQTIKLIQYDSIYAVYYFLHIMYLYIIYNLLHIQYFVHYIQFVYYIFVYYFFAECRQS